MLRVEKFLNNPRKVKMDCIFQHSHEMRYAFAIDESSEEEEIYHSNGVEYILEGIDYDSGLCGLLQKNEDGTFSSNEEGLTFSFDFESIVLHGLCFVKEKRKNTTMHFNWT